MSKWVAGIVFIVLGLVAAFVPVLFIEHEPYGSALTSDVVFYDVLEQHYLDMEGFLKKFPSYADMDAEQLARRLHAHYFSDISYESYRSAFLKATASNIPDTSGHGDPLGLRGDLKDITPGDVGARAVFGIDAIDHGLVTIVHKRVAFRYPYALGIGAAFCMAGVVMLFLGRKRRGA